MCFWRSDLLFLQFFSSILVVFIIFSQRWSHYTHNIGYLTPQRNKTTPTEGSFSTLWCPWVKNVQQELGQQAKARVGGEAVLSMVESSYSFYLPTGRASPEVGWRYYESVVTALRAKRGSRRGTGGRRSAAWLRVSLLGPEIWGGSDSAARWWQLTCRFSFILSRWTEWALREHELEPHYTTRTEGYWGRKRLGTDNYCNETLQSACSHACTTNEHTFEETLIPLCTPIES